MKAATPLLQLQQRQVQISIHAAREGGDCVHFGEPAFVRISIHAAREGGDGNNGGETNAQKVFQSTPPVKAATLTAIYTRIVRHISIHAAREGGDAAARDINSIAHISIHAAREGGDEAYKAAIDELAISIHAAREGGDFAQRVRNGSYQPFQSTPPVKAATPFYCLYVSTGSISIHAAREGGDRLSLCIKRSQVYFNPRRP